MALTVGTAPFGQHPAGAFNREMPAYKGLIYFEDSPRRIRARFGGETVVDSRPREAAPRARPPAGLLLPRGGSARTCSSRRITRATAPGRAMRPTGRCGWGSGWPRTRSGRYRIRSRAPRRCSGYRALYWNSMDEWFEEDEPAIVHARDPYHRVDVLETSRHVKVSLHGETARRDHAGARAVRDRAADPLVHSREDVRTELLEPSETRTGCAYKGFASYWSVRAGDELEDDLVWTYREPHRDVARIKDRLAFFNERVDLELDGELQERPRHPLVAGSALSAGSASGGRPRPPRGGRPAAVHVERLPVVLVDLERLARAARCRTGSRTDRLACRRGSA